ncbi:RluA family pseudouridine synthase [Priestia taiwanensis]|uniref:Pseudouridine synthase n=1 Tax=Priestia taiwanensis TaxID=1347902 RepID=A0A917ASG0_9BACI|nr:RluA family pseudouridine synthase [Priestia taiwanensis]MBM7364056.1 23S rRNA pseudouridine1911/1915/1917 synthase [Priestia taiwanensis]GGE71257.1 pseudouridine synthase [Priestia taiwanensis]
MKLERKGEWCELVVPSRWQGKAVQDVFREEFQLSKKLIHEFRMEKRVQVNGEVANWTKPLQKEDSLYIQLFVEEEYGVEPEYGELEVLFEDDHVLIVYKQAGMDTHPNEDGQGGTLANLVAGYYVSNGIQTKVRHIHRLDKDTTGAVIFAKHAMAGVIMDRLLAERHIRRHYAAVVHGLVKKKKDTIHASIGRDRHHATRRRVSPNGQEAITYYEVLQTFPKEGTTLVSLQLQTGRTHQIRVHMSYLGHPLLGDTLYGGKTTVLKRQALHAYKVLMKHPMTNERIIAYAPFPEDLAAYSQYIGELNKG